MEKFFLRVEDCEGVETSYQGDPLPGGVLINLLTVSVVFNLENSITLGTTGGLTFVLTFSDKGKGEHQRIKREIESFMISKEKADTAGIAAFKTAKA